MATDGRDGNELRLEKECLVTMIVKITSLKESVVSLDVILP